MVVGPLPLETLLHQYLALIANAAGGRGDEETQGRGERRVGAAREGGDRARSAAKGAFAEYLHFQAFDRIRNGLGLDLELRSFRVDHRWMCVPVFGIFICVCAVPVPVSV